MILSFLYLELNLQDAALHLGFHSIFQKLRLISVCPADCDAGKKNLGNFHSYTCLPTMAYLM